MNITPNQQDIQDAQNSGMIDKGWYSGKIISAEEGTNGSGNPCLTIEHKVSEGDRKGARIYTTFHNPENNPIARGTIVQLMMATGLQSLTDPDDQLSGEKVQFYVGVKKASTNKQTGEVYPEGREVRQYKAATAPAPVQTQPQPQPPESAMPSQQVQPPQQVQQPAPQQPQAEDNPFMQK